MLYLIDGNNLIGTPAGAAAREPRRRLIAELIGWLRPGRDRALVVFDGHDADGSIATSLLRGRLRVIWSGPQPADAVIHRRLDSSGAPRSMVLVTEDRELLARARARRVPTLGRSGWARLLEQAAEEQRRDPAAVDVADWLSYFEDRDR